MSIIGPPRGIVAAMRGHPAETPVWRDMRANGLQCAYARKTAQRHR
ncbi:hypothetical protein DM40_1681 [Burkholderia cenocepacia]|nr:hypothetical protein DM40_1681 [Burkholderia cenocepacia]